MSATEDKPTASHRKVKAETADVETAPTEQLDDGSSAQAAAGVSATADLPVQKVARPRIRWGAIVWGLIVCGIAATTLAITRTTEGREDFALWLTRLTPGGIWLIVVLAAGGILLLLGLLSTIRRLQRS